MHDFEKEKKAEDELSDEALLRVMLCGCYLYTYVNPR